jgi:hypothetical protein
MIVWSSIFSTITWLGNLPWNAYYTFWVFPEDLSPDFGKCAFAKRQILTEIWG